LVSRRKNPFSTLFFRQEYVTYRRSDKAISGVPAATVKISLRFDRTTWGYAGRAPAALRAHLRYRYGNTTTKPHPQEAE
jgi:hypothetical protein